MEWNGGGTYVEVERVKYRGWLVKLLPCTPQGGAQEVCPQPIAL